MDDVFVMLETFYDEGMMLHSGNVCVGWWRTEIIRKKNENSPKCCMYAPWSPCMHDKSWINAPNVRLSSSAGLYKSFGLLRTFTNGTWRVRKSIHVRIVVFWRFYYYYIIFIRFWLFWVVFGVELRCLAVITTDITGALATLALLLPFTWPLTLFLMLSLALLSATSFRLNSEGGMNTSNQFADEWVDWKREERIGLPSGDTHACLSWIHLPHIFLTSPLQVWLYLRHHPHFAGLYTMDDCSQGF